jgi:hypothetical protein
VTRSRTFRGALLAGVLTATLAMSACSVHPGSAAYVGSQSISVGNVDDVALALCAAQEAGGQGNPQQPQELASRAARQGALKVMIDSELSRQYGESQGIVPDQSKVSSAVAANAQSIAALPPSHRAVFTATLRDYATGQLMLVEAGRRSLEKAGQQNITEQQAVSEGTKLRNAWAEKHADVSVDPRYGSYSKNTLLSESGTLSVAETDTAPHGGSPDPSSGWGAALPASQKCS